MAVVVVVAFMACATLLDSLVLLFDPALYRRCMGYVEQEVGLAWTAASALAFLVPGLGLLLHVAFTGTGGWGALVGSLSILVGVFFALAATERFGWLADWWRSGSNVRYRLTGLAGTALSVGMLVLAFQLRRG